jgi:hypothetical protein
MGWLQAHTHGWPIFLGTTAALSAAAAGSYAQSRRNRLAWLWLIAWLLGVGAFYASSHLDQQRIGWPRMWGGQLLTIAVTVALPLGVVVAVLALWARRRAPHWALGAGLAAAAGAVTMLLAAPVSLWMFGLLQPWIMAGRH